MKKLTFYLSLVQTVLILLLLNNISKAQTSFNISNQTTGDTLFTIDNTGRVGIGLTVPDAGLYVNGTQWDDLSIGTYSVAIGWNTAAGRGNVLHNKSGNGFHCPGSK